MWKAYIQLTEAENAFLIHKSDLSIRPVWHQKEERVRAHILMCFLAYVLWKTLGGLCRNAGLGDEPRKVLTELCTDQTHGCHLANQKRKRNQIAMCRYADGSPGNFAPKAEVEFATEIENESFVVTTF